MTKSQKTRENKKIGHGGDSCCDDSYCGSPSARFESEGGGCC